MVVDPQDDDLDPPDRQCAVCGHAHQDHVESEMGNPGAEHLPRDAHCLVCDDAHVFVPAARAEH